MEREACLLSSSCFWLCVQVCLYFQPSLSLSVSLSLSLSLCVCLSVCLSVCVCVCVSLSLSVSLCLSVSVSVSLFLSLTLLLPLSVFLSLPHSLSSMPHPPTRPSHIHLSVRTRVCVSLCKSHPGTNVALEPRRGK